MTHRSATLPQPPVVDQALRYYSSTPDRSVYTTTTGEATATTGVVIVPELTSDVLTRTWQFSGQWQLSHTPSGLRVLPPVDGAGLGHLRDAAVLLAESGLDWAQPVEVICAPTSPYRERALQVRQQLHTAVAQARPLRLTTTSWLACPPLWEVIATDEDSAASFERYEQAVNYVTRYEIDGYIIRDEHPTWQLRCSWPNCGEPLIDDEFELTLRLPERFVLTERAREAGWRQLDQRRWLCPHCLPLFTPTTPL